MNRTEPKVFLIAQPQLDQTGLRKYLLEVGANEFEFPEEATDAELLCEAAGRICYRSWQPGLNANVSKVRDSAAYLPNVIKSKHGSVLEHAQVTFVFHHVSRVFTHELVRHRVGVAISQESLRYVRLTDLSVWFPSCLVKKGNDDPNFQQSMVNIVETLEEFQRDAAEAFGLDDEGVPFSRKKEVTSALRRLAPIGLATSIMWSSNFRTLRHVIEQRTSMGAEEEIRIVFQSVAEMCIANWPRVFGDYTRNDKGEYIPGTRKV